MRIARVFPRQTSMSPVDNDAYYDVPNLFTPYYDEVHISVTFTWDIERAKELAVNWGNHAKSIKIDGCAFGNKGDVFLPGMYIKKGITFTSRGCPYNCEFCLVPVREGGVRELPVVEGYIVQDNNFMACSKKHKMKVYDMLKTQSRIEFKGGLDKRLLTKWDIEQMRGLRIKSLWFSCDSPNDLKKLAKITPMLKDFSPEKKYCYVIIGKDKLEEEHRLREIWRLGFYPFAQLHRNLTDSIKYSKEWKRFARTWSRPAAYKSLLKEVKK